MALGQVTSFVHFLRKFTGLIMAHIYSYFLIGAPCPSTPGKNKFFPGSKINDFEIRQGASAINTGNLTTPPRRKLYKLLKFVNLMKKKVRFVSVQSVNHLLIINILIGVFISFMTLTSKWEFGGQLLGFVILLIFIMLGYQVKKAEKEQVKYKDHLWIVKFHIWMIISMFVSQLLVFVRPEFGSVALGIIAVLSFVTVFYHLNKKHSIHHGILWMAALLYLFLLVLMFVLTTDIIFWMFLFLTILVILLWFHIMVRHILPAFHEYWFHRRRLMKRARKKS
jgi:hypothetical protein